MRVRRDAWYEWDEDYTLAIDKWTNDTESLLTALMETGWFFRRADAVEASESVELLHVWYGESDDGSYVLCNEDGFTVDGTTVNVTSTVTIALIGRFIH